MMESLKKLEEEQRGFFESGAKISLIEEKERTVANRIEELSKEEQKNLVNLEDLSKELDSAKSDLSKIDEKVMQGIMNDSKKTTQSIESNLNKKDSDLIEKSLKEFWKKGYQYGLGESGEAVETINALRGQFASRNEQILKDKEFMKKDLAKEKLELSDLIETRKSQELKVIELRSNQDKANEEMRTIEAEITKLESEKERIMQQRNEKEVNKRTIEIDIKEKQERLETYLEVKDIDGDRDSVVQDLEKLQKRIMNLGPINFAAPETLEAEKERKETLSGQIEELETSLSKLDEAIRKIDMESNKSFHTCLNSVNKYLEEMFPKLFGGGFCKLDLLDKSEDAGLILMARLPGKKNTKLSQLSGGEKALTALALVFSLFSINPAIWACLAALLTLDMSIRYLGTPKAIFSAIELSAK